MVDLVLTPLIIFSQAGPAFFPSSLPHESEHVILSAAGAKDLLFDTRKAGPSLRARSARYAQDDMLRRARF